jgi:hypothetical protein
MIHPINLSWLKMISFQAVPERVNEKRRPNTTTSMVKNGNVDVGNDVDNSSQKNLVLLALSLTGSASETVNSIGFRMYQELRVQNQRRPIDFVCVVKWQFEKIPLVPGIKKKGCFQLQKLQKKFYQSQKKYR